MTTSVQRASADCTCTREPVAVLLDRKLISENVDFVGV
jgi:hypothetical protein